MGDTLSNAKEIANYDTIAANYADAIKGRADLEEINNFLKHVPPGGVVVDVGCAAGRDMAVFAEKGFKAVGVDLSEGLLSLARQRHPDLEFIKADLLNMPFDDNSVDGIWSRASLVHMETKKDAQAALNEFFRLLKPEGTVFVMVKAREEDEPEVGYTTDTLSGIRRGFRYYTLNEITDYAQQAGFKILNSEKFNERDRAEHMTDKSKIRNVDWIIFIAKKP